MNRSLLPLFFVLIAPSFAIAKAKMEATISDALRRTPPKGYYDGKYGRFTAKITVTNNSKEVLFLSAGSIETTLSQGDFTFPDQGVLFDSRDPKVRDIAPLKLGEKKEFTIHFSIYSIVPNGKPYRLSLKLNDVDVTKNITFKESKEPLEFEDWEKERMNTLPEEKKE